MSLFSLHRAVLLVAATAGALLVIGSSSVAIAIAPSGLTMAAADSLCDGEDALASDCYLRYLEVLVEAKTLAEIMPYWAKWMQKSAKKRTKAERQRKLESLKEEAEARVNVYVSSGEGDGAKTTLRLGAREPIVEDGQELDLYLTGEVVMVWDKKRWRIDEEAWWSE